MCTYQTSATAFARFSSPSFLHNGTTNHNTHVNAHAYVHESNYHTHLEHTKHLILHFPTFCLFLGQKIANRIEVIVYFCLQTKTQVSFISDKQYKSMVCVNTRPGRVNNKQLTPGRSLLRQLTNCATSERPFRTFKAGRELLPRFAEGGLVDGELKILKGLKVLFFLCRERHGLRIMFPGFPVVRKKISNFLKSC